MLDLILRGIFLSTAARAREIQETTADLYIHPPASEFDFLDFGKLDRFVASGYQAARVEIRRWRARTSDLPRG